MIRQAAACLILLTFASCSSVTYKEGYDNRTGAPYTQAKRWDIGRDTVNEQLSVGGGAQFAYGVGVQNESASFQRLMATAERVLMTYSAEKTLRNSSDNAVTMNRDDNKAATAEVFQKQKTSRHFETEKTKREAIEIIPELE